LQEDALPRSRFAASGGGGVDLGGGHGVDWAVTCEGS
jgi:hypothetical protein